MLLGWVTGIITRVKTYNKVDLLYKTYKDMLTEVYCKLVSQGIEPAAGPTL